VLRRAAVFGPAGIVLLAGLLSYAALQRGLRTRDWALHTRSVLDASARLLTALLDAETAERGFLITNDSAVLSPARNAPARADSMLDRLRRLTRDNPVQARRVDRLVASAHARLRAIDSTLRIASSSRSNEVARAIAVGPGGVLMADVRQTVDSLEAEEEGLLAQREREESRAAALTSVLLIGGTIGAGLLAFGVSRSMDRAWRARRAALDAAASANGRLKEQALELATQTDAARAAALEAEHASEHARAALIAAEESERRASRLQAATEAFGGALSLDDVANLIVDQALVALNAHSGILGALEQNGELRFLAVRDVRETAPGRAISVERDQPLCAAVRTGTPVLMGTAAEIGERFPEVVPTHRADGIEAVAAFPIENQGRVIGGLLVRFERPRSLSDSDVAFMAAMSRIAAESLERARLFEAERTARTAAEAANRAKAAFLASMSHELRTPLQAALGFAQLVRSGLYGPVTQEQEDVLARIERSQSHLGRLIDDILDFARLEAGHVRMNVETVSLAEAIGQLGPLVETQAAKKRLQLALRPPPEPIVVTADRDRLQQILVNLVGNAIKFTPEGGTIRVNASRSGQRAMIQVHDTGAGIPADRLQAIFEPFVQVDDRHTRAHSGVGLGLAISRDLATAMGGEIAVESELGSGSTFSVILPVAAAERTASADG